VKLYDAGELRRDVWELFLLNSRTPHFSDGDLYAQNAANARGAERLVELYGRYGAATMGSAVEEILDATERRARAAIREKLKPGSYAAVDWLDEDGIHDDPVKLGVVATVGEDRILFDFSQCSRELPTGKNIPLTHLMATVYYCLKAVLDPNMPVNAGFYRVVEVVAPDGSIVNPRPPCGVSSRNLTSMILADAIFNALGQAAPAQSVAAGGPYQGIILSGPDAKRGRYFVDYENFAGGGGGSAVGDGADVMQLHMTNTSNLPIEVMEIEFPVRVERYEMIADSGGPGRHRGGLGVCRELRIVAPDVLLANRSARQKAGAPGLFGGGAGGSGAYLLNPEGDARALRSTCSELPLGAGDLLRISTPGGGGFGEPLERDPARVHADLRDGKIGAEAAEKIYGVRLTPAGAEVDREATAALRRSLAAGKKGRV
jgi:N-methylhydantoinase B